MPAITDFKGMIMVGMNMKLTDFPVKYTTQYNIIMNLF